MDETVREWLFRAKSSLNLAKSHTENVCNEDLAYQAQQAVEKAIKALWLFYKKEPLRTHNLGALLIRAREFCEIPYELDAIVDLTDYAVQTRYPGEYCPVSKEELSDAIEIAESALGWIEKHITSLS